MPARLSHPPQDAHRLTVFRGDLNQVIEERRGGAEVGQACAGRDVAVDAVGGVFVPPDALRDDDAGLHGFADDGPGAEAAAIVEDTHPLAVTNVSGAGVARMD